MGFKVVVRQFSEPLVVEAGETVLQAAIDRGLDYPHGCRSGNCGACKSRLHAGEIELSPYSEFALSPAERAAGLILACRAVPWSDCEIAYLEPDEVVAHPRRDLTCRVVASQAVTHDIRRVRLAIEAGGPFDFSAGQYAMVSFDGLPARDFSMASLPGDEPLEFHIRLTPGGTVSPFVLRQLAVGDRVKVQGPLGISYLREAHRGPIVALAGGSGLAPIKSIVETALRRGAAQPIDLYFGVRDERGLYLEDHFLALAAAHGNFRFIPVLSEPGGPAGRRRGFLADAVRADHGGLDGCKAYLAGPPVMVESCVAALKALGVRDEDCHADAFYSEAEKAALEDTA
jgi:CDP-4-dehydro-6-deoxyglucose reductase/ferredoxin-NAD(P)+ reductase (naphthalene dioxygenase ferredoxin-specific)